MKKLLIGLGILLVLLVGITIGYYNSEEIKNGVDNLGGYSTGETLIGTSTSLCLLPDSAVFADSTTTDAAVDRGGCTLDQVIKTENVDTVLLNIAIKMGTPTSTFYLRQMGSQDGTNYFDLATSTANLIGMGIGDGLRISTSTGISTSPSGFIISTTTATTSISVPIQTTGYRFTRLVMYGVNTNTDPNDGAYAWITAVKVDPLTR